MRSRSQPSQSLDRLEIPASWPPHNQVDISIESLEDPKTCKDWRLVTHPSEIESYLMLRNRLHFGQAQGTPFTVPPLQDDFDWMASTHEADDILQGTYVSTTSVPNCMDLLSACKTQTSLDATPVALTIPEFRGKIHSWRENTTTSPSGRHLGRYKALFARGCAGCGDAPQETTLEEKQASIAALILSIINYCIRNTYVLERWKKIVNVMISKNTTTIRSIGSE